jgi:capsular exopolysaccharide synthesis family protein
MRLPTLAKKLQVRKNPGLSSFLTGQSLLTEVIQCCNFREREKVFHVIAAGQTPPNPVELLSSPQMKALLDGLSQKYDYIICDTPPVSVVTDAAALSRFCDGVILVVRQKLSSREQVWAARRNLDAVQANIIGTILSCYDMSNDTHAVTPYYGGYYRHSSSERRRKRKNWYD